MTIQVLFRMILIVFLNKVMIFRQTSLRRRFLTTTTLSLHSTLRHFSHTFVNRMGTNLMLTTPIITLPILCHKISSVRMHRRRHIRTRLLKIMFRPRNLPGTNLSLTSNLMVNVHLTNTINMSTLNISGTKSKLRRLFRTPRTTTHRVSSVIYNVRVNSLLIKPIGDHSIRIYFLSTLFLQRDLLPNNTTTRRRRYYRGRYRWTSVRHISSFR